MGDVTSVMTFKAFETRAPLIEIYAHTDDATVDDGDTFTITLADYGATAIRAIHGFIETTADSIVAAEAPTTAVSAGVLTVTVGGSTDDKVRSYFIFWE